MTDEKKVETPDYGKELTDLCEKIDGSEATLKAVQDLRATRDKLLELRKNSQCIGPLLTHVAGNCVRCFAEMALRRAGEALKKIEDATAQ
jgi:hypothetical protein